LKEEIDAFVAEVDEKLGEGRKEFVIDEEDAEGVEAEEEEPEPFLLSSSSVAVCLSGSSTKRNSKSEPEDDSVRSPSSPPPSSSSVSATVMPRSSSSPSICQGEKRERGRDLELSLIKSHLIASFCFTHRDDKRTTRGGGRWS